jgi:hypothetical protein
MEKGLKLRKLAETVRIQFPSARQTLDDLDDWAERLLNLADIAFGKMTEEYVTFFEVIDKLCQGCLD